MLKTGVFLALLMGVLVFDSSSGQYTRYQAGGAKKRLNPDKLNRAFLGSSKEDDTFASLSPEESKQKLAQMLTKIDTDSDGFIDRQELMGWMMRLHPYPIEQEAADRFMGLDRNRDEMISWDELYPDEDGSEKDMGEDTEFQFSEEEERQSKVDDEERFEAADTNLDGQLDFDEFIVFSVPEEFPHMFDLLLAQILRHQDANKDGKIDFQEYALLQSKYQKEYGLVTLRQDFDEIYDKDKDGVLTGAEVVSWLYPKNEEFIEDYVSHMFAMIDADRDGRLSHQDILDKRDIFVGPGPEKVLYNYLRKVGEL